jgi:hypothetical protein
MLLNYQRINDEINKTIYDNVINQSSILNL